ncbi:MAG: DUF6171 family protein [Minisyncoccia bacterium]
MTNEENDRDVKPWDLINGSPRSTEELHLYRLSICEKCEFYRLRSNTCKKCGCFMTLKTKLEHAKCPIGKW